MIDSHCHLADKAFASDRDAVIKRASEQGVTTMICIGDTLEESGRCIALAERYEQVFATVGVHPHVAKEWRVESRELVGELSRRSSKVVAIGEIGLDYHYDSSPREIQREVFRMQLELAKELALPAVVHCREAVEDVWNIVDEIKPLKLVLHCCTEKFEDVERFIERGYLLSFTGIATYPNADTVRATIRRCPMDQLMIETDAPYLAPIPYRGKRNEPAFVVEVAKCVAEIKGMSLDDVDAIATKNTERFFALPHS